MKFVKENSELLFWCGGIIILFFAGGEALFSICPLNNLGFQFCPGCGLGASIHYLLRFNFPESFSSHPFGIAAFIIILFRVIKLLSIKSIIQKLPLR
jgi:hypothetical protein